MEPIVKGYKSIGRNEICPCGSKMKFKFCCLNKIKAKERAVYEDIGRRRRAVEQASYLARRMRNNPPKKVSQIILP